MPSITLHILGDASDVARAMGDVQGMAQRTEAAITGERRKGAQQRRQDARRELDERRRGERELTNAQRAAERERTAAQRAESRRRAQVEREEGAVRRRELAAATAEKRRAEREATATTKREARERGRAADDEMRARTRADQAFTRASEQEERRRTQTARREAVARRNNATAQRRTGEAIGRGIGTVVGAGARFVTNLHGQVQDARQNRAGTEHSLNAAFYQAGVQGNEAAAMRREIYTATTSGGLRGLRSEDVAGALTQAQTQFSVLAGPNQGARMGNLREQIRLMEFARNTYQSPAEVLRAAGMLRAQGISGQDTMSTLMAMSGMAQAGSVELSTMVQQGLGPLSANIGASLRPGMTAAQRSAVVQATTLETMAAGEVGAAAGLTPRDSLNSLAKLRRAFGSERIAGNLAAGLTARGVSATEQSKLLETVRGPGGRQVTRFRNTDDVFGNLDAILRLTGGDARAASNMLQGGGHGTPQVLDAQARRFVGAMASQTTSGETMTQHIAGMRARGAAFGEADVTRGRVTRDAEEQTRATQAEERRLSAMTDNTSRLVQLSNALTTWSAANPITSGALQAGGTVAASLFGPRLGSLAGRALAAPAARVAGALGAGAGGAGAASLAGVAAGVLGGAVNAGAMVTGRTAGGQRLSGTQRLLRGLGITGLGSGLAVALTGGALAPTMQIASGLGDLASAAFGGGGGARPSGGSVTVRLDPASAQMLAAANARELAGTPLQVGTDLHTNATQGARNASGSTPPAP